MKNYTITVNGTSYDVTVEEGGAGSTPKASAPKAAPKQKAAPAQKPAASTGAQGAVKVSAPMPGNLRSNENGKRDCCSTGWYCR